MTKSSLFAWAMVASTVLLTAYGQLILKWQVGVVRKPAFEILESAPIYVQWLFRPWVISAFIAAFLAALTWMLALSRLDLSRAYPFMALNFLLVSLLAVPLFGEFMTAGKLVGLALVVIGLIVMNLGS